MTEEEIEKLTGRFVEVFRLAAKGIPEGYGLGLFVFTLGQGGRTFYFSSVEREDLLVTLLEFIEAQEADMLDRVVTRRNLEAQLERTETDG